MESSQLKFAFWGTPLLSAETLDILVQHGYIPCVVITAPDAKSGRGMRENASPVAEWAEEHGIPCLKPEKIDDEFRSQFSTYNIELSVVVAYGKILPKDIISTPRFGTINIHYSLLPKYRGASPLEQALLNGDTETGVSIQQMEHRLDSGPVLAELVTDIDPNETKESLRARLTQIGGETLVKLLPQIIEGTTNPKQQDDTQASYCTKIEKSAGEIDPLGNARENWNKYRAFFGWPGIFFFTVKNGTRIRIKITQASFKEGQFIIEKVIPEGKKEINYTDFLRNS